MIGSRDREFVAVYRLSELAIKTGIKSIISNRYQPSSKRIYSAENKAMWTDFSVASF